MYLQTEVENFDIRSQWSAKKKARRLLLESTAKIFLDIPVI